MVASSITGVGQVHLTHVATSGAPGDMVSVSPVLGNGTPTFYVCHNYLNGLACLYTSSSYACANKISQRVLGCTATPTPSSTFCKSNSNTPSLPPQNTTPTVSPTSSNNTSATPTASTSYPSATKTSTTSQSPLMSVSLHSPSSTVLIADTVSPTTTPSLPTNSISPSSPRTSTPSVTAQTSTPSPTEYSPCNFTCVDVVAAFNLPTSADPSDAVAAYCSSYIPSGGRIGCAPLMLPYAATYGGKRALVLVHIGGPFDATYVSAEALHLTASLATVDASLVSGTLTVVNETAVMVVEVARHAAEPARAESSTLTLPPLGLLCATSTSLLPTFNIEVGSSPSPLTEDEKTAIAVVSVASVDLQTVAAMGLLRCTPGTEEDAESESTIRALVPVALSGTCVGAIQGALLLIGVACVATMCTTGILRRVRGLSWVQAAGVVRCPGLVLSVWGAMQMGLVVCGGRLASSESGYRGLGVAGLVAGAALPFLTVSSTYLFVSRRCLRLGQTSEALEVSSPLAVRLRSLMLPRYELDFATFPTSAAFSTVVGKYRRPCCLWTGLAQAQPLVMLLVVLSPTAACTPTLVVAGVAAFHI